MELWVTELINLNDWLPAGLLQLVIGCSFPGSSHHQAGKCKCPRYIVGGLPVHFHSCFCLKLLCWSFISRLVCWMLCLTFLTFFYVWSNSVKLFQLLEVSVSTYKVWNIVGKFSVHITPVTALYIKNELQFESHHTHTYTLQPGLGGCHYLISLLPFWNVSKKNLLLIKLELNFWPATLTWCVYTQSKCQLYTGGGNTWSNKAILFSSPHPQTHTHASVAPTASTWCVCAEPIPAFKVCMMQAAAEHPISWMYCWRLLHTVGQLWSESCRI